MLVLCLNECWYDFNKQLVLVIRTHYLFLFFRWVYCPYWTVVAYFCGEELVKNKSRDLEQHVLILFLHLGQISGQYDTHLNLWLQLVYVHNYQDLVIEMHFFHHKMVCVYPYSWPHSKLIVFWQDCRMDCSVVDQVILVYVMLVSRVEIPCRRKE